MGGGGGGGGSINLRRFPILSINEVYFTLLSKLSLCSNPVSTAPLHLFFSIFFSFFPFSFYKCSSQKLASNFELVSCNHQWFFFFFGYGNFKWSNISSHYLVPFVTSSHLSFSVLRIGLFFYFSKLSIDFGHSI